MGRLVLVMLAALAASTPAAGGAPGADEAAIIARLQGWAAAFNARDAAGACDLFAPDLVSIVPDAPPAGKEEVCARLRHALALPGRELRYEPDIREVIVSGDLAVVRLFWELTVRKAGAEPVTSTEAGIDVFMRQPDGRWSISRFIAFPYDPGAGR